MEVQITTENLEQYKSGELPLVVDLWATWCGKIVVGKCDVEANDDVTIEYRVRNIPTILFFKGGELVDKHVGAITEGDLRKKFDALL